MSYDMIKADKLAEEMCLDIKKDEASLDFGLICGNIEFLNGEIAKAKNFYKTSLRRLENEPNAIIEG